MYRPFESLPQVLREKRIRVRFHKGYRRWKKTFYQTLKQTRGDVLKALEQINERPLVSQEKQSSTTPTRFVPGALRV
jgi:hypothetical protein